MSEFNLNDLKALLRNSLINQVGVANSEEALDVDVIALYFSAHWCPPCRILTPMLIEFHKAVNQERKRFEVIYFSQDRDEETFLEYFEIMPWLAIPFTEEDSIINTGDLLGIYGIPSMVILNRNLDIIDSDGRCTLYNKGQEALTEWENLAKQAAKKEGAEAKPSEAASEAVSEENKEATEAS
mmetsp:Transcript_5389/g.9931  ORF Transcript_5389/g.9931 Transcript_5389/m.9931 type:complete len:183 (-) Transcript_5389:2653-3201(-)